MDVELPAVTLTDPWASLCVAGIKTLETRKGALLSGFRGPLVIHRSLAPCDPYDLSRWGLSVPTRPDGWPTDDRGMALGVVFVAGTYRGHFLRVVLDGSIEAVQRRACFEDIEGRYLSDLTHAAWFPAPIKARGKQYRFTIKVPASYLPEWVVQ